MDYVEEILSLSKQLGFDGEIKVRGDFHNVVIAGMGGSGIAGRIFAQMYSRKPVILVDSYDIPDFVGPSTFFVSLSYSGNTEETISATEKAMKRGASVAAVTTGGKLSEIVGEVVLIPSGLQPRSAVGYLTIPLLRGFGILGEDDVSETRRELQDIDRNTLDLENAASEIFQGKKIPVILGTKDTEAVSYRWKTQFNENSKILAYSANFPELNHNDTMPLRFTYRKEEFHFFSIITKFTPQAIRRRIEVTSRLCGLKLNEVRGEGESYLSNIFTLIHKGDYISYFLGKMRGVDPRDVGIIEDLKSSLKAGET
ncbi:MAG: bifunctional phosphoglucose/phosphomannose isomerase [Thermoplasmata archaeon]